MYNQCDERRHERVVFYQFLVDRKGEHLLAWKRRILIYATIYVTVQVSQMLDLYVSTDELFIRNKPGYHLRDNLRNSLSVCL